jgi:putative ABC transport system ATP-binding protein
MAAAALPEAHGVAGSDVLIEIKGVAKDYVSAAGVVRALKDVDIDIRHGEFVAIVGTSGSGKSTLMNILGCLDRPTHGTYALAGLDVGARTNDGRAIVRNRLIGFIFQGFNLLPRTTALENVELPLQYRGVPAAARRKRALAALAQVGLQERVHHTPNQLSGGQQQRVAIARALVTDPPLLLADEPTGNLDTRTSLEVLALLQELNKRDGITIVLVTHEHDIAACAQRVITFRDGRVQTDLVQEKPMDAAQALAELPLPQDGPSRSSTEEEEDPVLAARMRRGGPVPFAVYAAMLGGSLLGALTGFAYNGIVLGDKVTWIVLALALLGESFLGARVGKRRLGRPLTNDQRARIGIVYTLATVAVVAPYFLYRVPQPIVARLEGLSVGALTATGLVFVLGVAAMALLRFLLLSLFAPKR